VRAFSAAIAIWVLGSGISGAPPSFHHIHVNDNRPGALLSYYGKLFDPSTTHATALANFQGIEGGGLLLLITPVRDDPPEEGGAGWHFGWGSISLDEAYDRHRMQEADLKLPIPSFASDLHVHLESEDPVAAARWYRDRFGAEIVTRPENAEVRPVNSYYRRPAAIVTLPQIAFAIYKSMHPLSSSRGHRIDHLAFTADLHEVRAAGFTVLENEGRLGSFETMTIEGPDHLVIEFVTAAPRSIVPVPR
jgi:hypothetical protein